MGYGIGGSRRQRRLRSVPREDAVRCRGHGEPNTLLRTISSRVGRCCLRCARTGAREGGGSGGGSKWLSVLVNQSQKGIRALGIRRNTNPNLASMEEEEVDSFRKNRGGYAQLHPHSTRATSTRGGGGGLYSWRWWWWLWRRSFLVNIEEILGGCFQTRGVHKVANNRLNCESTRYHVIIMAHNKLISMASGSAL